MKCQRCGADIPKGEVFCFECGEEVQLVPDFNSVEYMIQQKQALEEIELRKEQERLRKQARQEKKEAEQRKKKKKKLIFITLLIVVLMAVISVAVVILIRHQQENSFEYQYAKAYEAYESGDFSTAEEYAKHALSLSPNNDNAILLMAEIEISKQNIDAAAELLKTYIDKYPESLDAYERLIFIYEEAERLEDIYLLMSQCKNEQVLNHFSDYITPDVQFVTAPGEYSTETLIELAYSGGTVYYTTDDTDPSMSSKEYVEPILLEEGTTVFKAIAYSRAGIPGEIMEVEYTVTYARPNPPFISPASGDYEEGDIITVIVPDGCKAYYTFDGTANSSCELYTEPVTMLDGEHFFSAVLVNEYGKESYPASETYVVS